MQSPELDWRLDDAPDANEPAPLAPPRPRRGWRAALPWLALLAGLALGVYVFQRLGWQRLNAQVAAEVRFEDERALARDRMAVLAVQSNDEAAWRHRRGEEAALGLPAPLPAPHLAPAGTPPQMLRLDTTGGDVFTATVRRHYLDAAGQAYAFDLAQRYRNLGPGLWQRLPPLLPGDAAGWEGTRLTASSLPQGEQAVWTDVLRQADALLAQACADWGCPPDLVLRLQFSGKPDDLPRHGQPAWATDPAAAQLPGYSPVFDLLTAQPGVAASGPQRVPALSLIGVPAGERERRMLAEALTHHALYALAARHSQVAGPAGDPYFAALLARASARLGLTPPAQVPLESALSPAWLWEVRTPRRADGQRPPETTSLAGRQQVLGFLDHALRSQPPEADGRLLRSLLRDQPLANWLSAALGEEAVQTALTEWAQALTDEHARRSGLPPPDAGGLHFACDGSLGRVGPGGVETLMPTDQFTAAIGNVAVSERYAAYLRAAPPGGLQLVLVEPGGRLARVIAQAGRLNLLGWSSAGQLLYLARNPANEQSLMRYDPASDRHVTLFDGLSAPDLALFVSWSADRTLVGLNQVLGNTANGLNTAPVAVRVVDPVGLQVLAEAGFGTWLSPDGRHAAYLVVEAAGSADLATRPMAVRVVALDNPNVTVAEATHPPAEFVPGVVGFVNWAPDSQSLVYAAAAENGVGVYALALTGAPSRRVTGAEPAAEPMLTLPVGFSADGRYLALVQFVEDINTVSLLPWPAGPHRDYTLAGSLTGLAWSLTGHTLALPTTGGLFVTDSDTGAGRWVTFGDCSGVGW